MRAAPNVTRIEYVDGLRAVAVLAVMAAHVAVHGANISPVLGHAMLEGSHGVDLFFVLSGFCLAYPTLHKWRSRTAKGFNLHDFGAKRLVRIAPPFYIATLILLIAGLAAKHFGHGTVMGIPSALDLGKSLLFFDEHTHLINSSFWTLMVEFRWYFAFPFLLALWLRSPRCFTTVGIASIVLYELTRARGLDFGTLPGFMLGIVAADVHLGARWTGRTPVLVKRHALWLAPVCCAIGIAVESRVFIPGFDGNDVRWPFVPTIAAWQFGVFFLVVAAGATPLLRRLLGLRALVATGVASYAIYLVHEPIIAEIEAKLHGPSGCAIAAASALAAGFLFWALAERPFTSGSLRAPLVRGLQPLVARACTMAGLPAVLHLPAAAIPEADGPFAGPVPIPAVPLLTHGAR